MRGHCIVTFVNLTLNFRFIDRHFEKKIKAHEAAVAERKKLMIRMSPRNPEKRPKNYSCPNCHHKDDRIAEVGFMKLGFCS